MATARKRFKPQQVNVNPAREPALYAAFMASLLKGTIVATKLVETRTGQKLDLDYDDPNG